MLWQFLDEGGVGVGYLVVLVLGLGDGWVGKLSLLTIIQVSPPALPWPAHPAQQTARRRFSSCLTPYGSAHPHTGNQGQLGCFTQVSCRACCLD